MNGIFIPGPAEKYRLDYINARLPQGEKFLPGAGRFLCQRVHGFIQMPQHFGKIDGLVSE